MLPQTEEHATEDTDDKNFFSIGIDPGWKNLGLAVVKNVPGTYKSELIISKVYNPSSYKSPECFVDEVLDQCIAEAVGCPWWIGTSHLCIERYVAYANMKTAEAENITSLIGMMSLLAYQKSTSFDVDGGEEPIDIWKLRAIEWKVSLVQTLAKYTEFRNPSSKLDKKFSMALAKELLYGSSKLETDHEADAVCLAAYPHAKRYFETFRKPS